MLVISVLILGVGRAPMPRAEYHVIAHQDGTGRNCSLHEHLLRLHPIAGADHGQHAALHWHWALPHPADPHGPNTPEGESEDIHVPPTGADLLVEEGPSVAHPAKLGLWCPILLPTFLDATPITADLALISGHASPWDPDLPGTLARGSSLTAWLQRWTC